MYINCTDKAYTLERCAKTKNAKITSYNAAEVHVT